MAEKVTKNGNGSRDNNNNNNNNNNNKRTKKDKVDHQVVDAQVKALFDILPFPNENLSIEKISLALNTSQKLPPN